MARCLIERSNNFRSDDWGSTAWAPKFVHTGRITFHRNFTGLLGEFMVHSEESATPRHWDKGGAISVIPAGFANIFARLLLPIVAYLGVLDVVPCSWYVPLNCTFWWLDSTLLASPPARVPTSTMSVCVTVQSDCSKALAAYIWCGRTQTYKSIHLANTATDWTGRMTQPLY